ncbi:amidohydrolase family protein [Parapedobacter indicus]|uniref:L-fuconolactonase n=1 Tax=Parapedobacter indicus TaxID=1477437 RepID=A0A1I3RYU2_9SPHI|nr:amidohydrolase family protein [Parapedobacter indicus]PPK99920.1 L-fuconolactonase [Parapedobacter indicus]SFJ51804.1 L-fuconolactonase [Parapedobacter indicus]
MNAIIDTHVHCWNLERARYDWLEGNGTLLNRNYAFSELQPEFQQAGIAGGMLVQAANNVDDTELMLEIARAFPTVVGVVGWLPLEAPEDVQRLIEGQFRKEPHLKGVRHLIHNETDAKWLLREPVLDSLRILAAECIPYDVVGVLPEHLETVLEVAERIPGLRLMLDHLNQPPIAAKETFGRWGELMSEVCQHTQVWCKISGLGTTTGKGNAWTAEDIKPYVAYVLELFGVERCICGGDWPVSLLAGSYAHTWQTYREVIGNLLPPGEQAQIYRENAIAFYKLEMP